MIAVSSNIVLLPATVKVAKNLPVLNTEQLEHDGHLKSEKKGVSRKS